MQLEISTLRMSKHRKYHERFMGLLRTDTMDLKTATILKDFDAFFKATPGVETIDIQDFKPFFKMRHPQLKPEDMQLYWAMLDNIVPDVGPEVAATIGDRLLANNAAYELLSQVDKYIKGETEGDLLPLVQDIVTEFEGALERKVRSPEVLDDIEDLLELDKNHTGLTFRWDCLSTNMRPMRGGDFVIIAARPDVGKTTAITDNVTHMAPQLDALWPHVPGRPVVWFNNEGPGNRIKKRTVQSALNLLTSEMVDLSQQPSTQGNRSLLIDKFNEATAGGFGRIRIFDIHDFWHHEVEAIIKKTNAGLIIFDMIDNIKFGGGLSNQGSRTDQVLEAMYQWARIICVKYDAVGIATSQVSGDGEGLQYPLLGHLKDSKTGKQGAAEVIVTIGMDGNPLNEALRYIGCTKNKLVAEGGKKNPQHVMTFDGQRGRYLG